MNVAIVLAGLTPRAKQIDGMGFGGTPAWRFEDRIALLAGLKGPALDWAYYRYCGHEVRLLPVLRHLQFCIDMYCGVNKIRIKRETRAGILNVAISDFMAPTCPVCDGAGVVNKTSCSADVVCDKCHGAGRKRISSRQMCNKCGISHQSWSRYHDMVLYEATKLIASLDAIVIYKAHENAK